MKNLFLTAKALPATPKAKKSAPVMVQIDDLENLAAVRAQIKALGALEAVYLDAVKDNMKTHFVTVGCAAGDRPANFKGADGVATASCQLRDRSAKLSDDEIELLKGDEIPMVKKVRLQHMFAFNPEYMNDSALLERVSKAILKAKIPGVPDDLIVEQKEECDYVVAENALKVLFTKSKAVVNRLLSTVGVLAVQAKIDCEMSETSKKVAALIEGNAATTTEELSIAA